MWTRGDGQDELRDRRNCAKRLWQRHVIGDVNPTTTGNSGCETRYFVSQLYGTSMIAKFDDTVVRRDSYSETPPFDPLTGLLTGRMSGTTGSGMRHP